MFKGTGFTLAVPLMRNPGDLTGTYFSEECYTAVAPWPYNEYLGTCMFDKVADNNEAPRKANAYSLIEDGKDRGGAIRRYAKFLE